MHPDTRKYNDAQAPADREICELLAREIDRHLPEAENKIWHAHPVWFLDGNPIVGYSKLKSCVRLLFWSGQSFEEKGLTDEGTFKAALAELFGYGTDLRSRTRGRGTHVIQFDVYEPVRRTDDDDRDSVVGAPVKPSPRPKDRAVALPEPDDAG